MLTVIHMVKGLQKAQATATRLGDEGFFVRVRPVYKALPPPENYFEIQVLSSEVQEAQALLLEKGLL